MNFQRGKCGSLSAPAPSKGETQDIATVVLPKGTYEALRARISELEGEIRKALNELGVPQPGYPAPVANAVEILDEALKGAK